MMKRWSLIAMAGALLGAVSCAPVGGSYSGVNGVGPSSSGVASVRGSAVPTGSVGSGERATSGDLRQLREQRAQASGEQVINPGVRRKPGGGSSLPFGEAGSSGEYEAQLPPMPSMNIDYRYAMPVPGRKGWVYNPYTNRTVDVRGVGSGRLIYDERDPENRMPDGTLKPVSAMPNKFRVP